MRIVVIIFVLLLLIFGLKTFSATRIEQNELAFKYNLLSGKAVNPEDNPLLNFGWTHMVGWNEYVFRVSSEAHQYEFTSTSTENSPFDESLTFDSTEGVTGQFDYAIIAHIDDVWKFYENYGNNQYSYTRGYEDTEDPRLYEGIREVGSFIDVYMGQLTQDKSATYIRTHPSEFKEKLKDAVREYSKQFGIVVDDILLTGRLRYPDGKKYTDDKGVEYPNVIEYTTDRLGNVYARLQEEEKDVEKASGESDAMIAKAMRDADRIRSQADITAAKLNAEAEAIANELAASVEKIGIEGTMKIYMARNLGNLIEKGVIPFATLTEDSILGEAFYPQADKK